MNGGRQEWRPYDRLHSITEHRMRYELFQLGERVQTAQPRGINNRPAPNDLVVYDGQIEDEVPQVLVDTRGLRRSPRSLLNDLKQILQGHFEVWNDTSTVKLAVGSNVVNDHIAFGSQRTGVRSFVGRV